MTAEQLWNGVTLECGGGFPLGTDSVLLADFVRVPGGSAVCDLGCGSGAIALMLLADDRSLSLTGVEIQPSLAALAQRNADENGLADRFRVLTGDLRRIRDLLPASGFDAVVSNPPYYAAHFPPPDRPDAVIARTERCCKPEDLCTAAAWLLRSGGKLFLCHLPERLADVIVCLRSARLEPRRLQFVRHRPGCRRNLFLMEAALDGGSGLDVLDDLVLFGPDGAPTEAYRRAYHL